MAEPILVNAPSRTLRELYGPPPPGTIIECMQPMHEGDPTCAPKRGSELTDREWYAEQEAKYGKYAELKAKRPKQSWWGGQKEESAQQQESAQAAPSSPGRQPQRLTVQQQLRQQRQIADTSGVPETRTPDGIYWFTIESEEVNA